MTDTRKAPIGHLGDHMTTHDHSRLPAASVLVPISSSKVGDKEKETSAYMDINTQQHKIHFLRLVFEPER